MAEEGLTNKILDTLTGGVVNHFIEKIRRRAVESVPIRRFKDKFGIGKLHDLTEDIIRASISDAYIEVKSCKDAIKGFLKDEKNSEIISEWIINPDSIEESKKGFEKKYAIKRTEKQALDLFITSLQKNIRVNRKEKFPPDALSILNELSFIKNQVSEVNEISKETQSGVELINDRLSLIMKEFSISDTKLDNKDRQKEIERVEDLIERGKIIDARNKAIKLIDTASNLEDDFLCQLNRLIANTYLQEEREQKKAIPYLEEAVNYCEDNVTRRRNKVLALLLRDELEEALEESEKLINIKKDVDSIGLKANILWLLDRAEEAFNFLLEQEDFKGDHQHLNNLSYAALRNNDIQNAYKYSKKSIEIKEDFIKGFDLLSSVISLKYQEKQKSDFKIWPTTEDEKELKKAKEYSSKVLSNIGDQKKDQICRVLTNRALINHWLGLNEDALNDLLEAKEINSEDVIVLKNLAFIYSSNDEEDKALKQIEELSSLLNYEDQDLIRLRAILLVNKGEPDIVIEFLVDHLDLSEIKEELLELYMILVRAYDRSLETDKAEELLAKLELEFPNNSIVGLAKVQHLHLLGEYKDALELSYKYDGDSSEKIKTLLKLERAEILFERRDKESFSKAADIFGELSNRNQDDYFLRKYALSLFNSQRYLDCLRICKNIQGENPIELYTKLEGDIYYATQNFVPAKESYKWLAQKNPNSVSYIRKLAYSYFRLNETKKAYQVIRQVAKKIKEPASDLIAIAFTFATIGKIKEASEYAHKAIELGGDNAVININYLNLWLTHFRDPSDIKDEYIKKFQSVSSEFSNKFPEYEGVFESIETPRDDIESLKEELIKRMPSSDWLEGVDELFQKKIYPIEVLSKIVGRDLYTTWETVASSPNYGLYCNSGDASHLENEKKVVMKSSTIFLDPISLFSISEIGLIHELNDFFEKIYVPQITLDTLLNVLEYESSSIENGGMTLYERDGKLYRKDIPTEVIETKVNQLKELIEFISNTENRIELVGKSPEREQLEVDIENGENLEHLGEITNELLFEAKAKEIPLYSEDFMIRQIGEDLFDIESFGTRAFLEVLLSEGKISDNDFHDSIMKLIHLNYHFVSFQIETLKRLAEKNLFQINEDVITILEEFKRPNQALPNLLNVAANFIKWIWDEVNNDKMRESWSFLVLNVIGYGRNKRLISNNFKDFASNSFHWIDAVRKDKFLQMIDDWYDSQMIV